MKVLQNVTLVYLIKDLTVNMRKLKVIHCNPPKRPELTLAYVTTLTDTDHFFFLFIFQLSGDFVKNVSISI